MKHTGKQALRNPHLVEAISAGVAANTSNLQIAKTLKISPSTVAAVKQQINSHQLGEWKERTISNLEQLASKCLGDYESALAEGKVNPNSLPVHAAIFIDKRSALLTESVATPALDRHDGLDAVLSELKALKPVQVQVNVAMPGAIPAPEQPAPKQLAPDSAQVD